MDVAETWQPPDWFASPAPGIAGVRIMIVDGSDADELRLLDAARVAGIECSCGRWAEKGADATLSPATAPLKPALLFEAAADLAAVARGLRALRSNAQLAALPALLVVQPGQLAQLDVALGFDDFVLQPYLPLEVRARIRAVAQRRRVPAVLATAAEEVLDEDGLQVDAVAHEALVDGRVIRMTAREFALFAYLRARPERVLTRQHLLERVWGYRYRGGPRTVDTHIGRLRLKFGAAFPIETVRSNGYRLRLPAAAAPEPAPLSAREPARERAAHELAAQDSSSHAAE